MRATGNIHSMPFRCVSFDRSAIEAWAVAGFVAAAAALFEIALCGLRVALMKPGDWLYFFVTNPRRMHTFSWRNIVQGNKYYHANLNGADKSIFYYLEKRFEELFWENNIS